MSQDTDFGIRTMTGLVQRFAQEEALNGRFTSLFGQGQKVQVEGDTFEWDEVSMHRHLAPVTGRDGPFPILEETDSAKRKGALIDVKLSKVIPGGRLRYERGLGKLVPDAQLWLDTQVRDLVKAVKQTIEYLCVNTLAGSLVVSSATVPGTTVPFTISSSVNTYTAANSWATAATKIVSAEMPALKQDALQSCGILPVHAIIGGTIQGYIAQNTEVLSLVQYQKGPDVADSAARLFGQTFESFMLGGLTYEVNESVYTPQGGSPTRFMPATDKGFLLPADSELPGVLGFAEGKGLVPLGPDVIALEQAESLNGLAPAFGFYGYAARSGNPRTNIELFVGWRGSPYLLHPAAVCVFDTVP